MGHKIGAAIIGKDNGKPAEPDADDKGAAITGFSNINVRPAANGFTVSHTPKPIKPEDPATEQSHVFRDAQEAHHHIGQLLGVRMASGLQKT
jgi:hypothetical protein